MRRYLAKTHPWTEATPIADLAPNILQEFLAWLLQQRQPAQQLDRPCLSDRNDPVLRGAAYEGLPIPTSC